MWTKCQMHSKDQADHTTNPNNNNSYGGNVLVKQRIKVIGDECNEIYLLACTNYTKNPNKARLLMIYSWYIGKIKKIL